MHPRAPASREGGENMRKLVILITSVTLTLGLTGVVALAGDQSDWQKDLTTATAAGQVQTSDISSVTQNQAPTAQATESSTEPSHAPEVTEPVQTRETVEPAKAPEPTEPAASTETSGTDD